MLSYGNALKSTTTDYKKLIELTGSLSLEQTKNVLIAKKLDTETVKNVLSSRNLTEAEVEATAATIAKATATTTATVATGSYTAALIANAKAMAMAMLTNPATYIFVLVAAIGAAVTAYKKFNPTIEEQRENLEKLSEEYKEATDKLKSLTDEQKENLKLIDELQKKKDNGTITLVEEDQLNKLKLQNELLEQQISLQQIIADEKKANLRDENRETFNNDFGGDLDEIHKNEFYSDGTYLSQFRNYKKLESKELVLLLKENEKRINDAIVNNDTETLQTLTEQKKVLVQELSNESADALSTLLGYKENIVAAMTDDGKFADDTDEQMYEAIESWEKDFYKYTNRSGEWNAIKIKTAIDENSLEDVQNKLSQQLKNGIVTTKDINLYSDLVDALSNTNLIIEEGQSPLSVYLQYLKGIGEAESEIGNAEIETLSFEEVLAGLEESHTLLESVTKEVSETKRVSIDSIQDIISKYPQLTALLSDYVEGKKTETDVINALSQEYSTDLDNYKQYILQKNGEDENFYNNIIENLSQDLINKAEAYGIDLESYKSYTEAKLKMDQLYEIKKAALERKRNKVQQLSEDAANREFDPENPLTKDDITLLKLRANLREEEMALEEYEKFLEEFDTSIEIQLPDFNKDLFKKSDGSGGGDDEKFEDSIDWNENTISNIESKIARLNEQIANTDGIDEKIELLNELKEAQKDLAKIKEGAVESYKEDYDDALDKLTPEQKKKYQALIESDGEIDIKDLGIENFEGKKGGAEEKLFNNIKAAHEFWKLYQQALTESESANQDVKDTEKLISDTDVLERSKERQEDFEAQLDTVNEKLNDSTLSTEERNDLLEQQYTLQKSINDELRIQAKYNEDDETVAKLDAEDKNNENKKNTEIYDNNKEDTLRKVEKNDNLITDVQNDIDAAGKGTVSQYEKIISLQASNIGYWVQQKKYAEDMRNANKDNVVLYQYWDNELQECENQINDMNNGIKEMRTAILNIPLQEVEEKLRSINKELNSQNRKLDEKTDLINAAIGIFDTEIDKQNLVKESLEDKIEILEKEQEIRKSNIAVQKAEWELEKARSNKTTKVFKEGVGFVFESDDKEVREAELNLEEATNERKIALLNQEVKDIDTTIKLLNRQKKEWEDITVLAERNALLSKGLTYDAEFRNRVLSGHIGLLETIKSEYGDVYSSVFDLEESKKPFEALQEELTDIGQLFSLNAISYNEALSRTKDVIRTYYPELLSVYDEQGISLEDVAKKQLASIGITEEGVEESTEESKKEIKKTNEEITQSYDQMLKDVTNVFSQLETLLKDFSDKASVLAKYIVDSFSAVSSAISNGVTDFNDGVLVDKDNDKSNKATNKGVTKTKYQKVDDETLDFYNIVADTVKAITPNVTTKSNTSVPTTITTNNKSTNITFGDIVVNEVKNTSDFAKTIVSSLTNVMKQELYK